MNETDKKLLDDYQRDFPLVARPFAEIGRELGISEDEVISAFARRLDEGAISRIGAVIRPGTIGASTLAAMKVPAERLDEIAGVVSGYDEVNHNYERDHEYNLWFVVTAPDRQRVGEVLADIENKTAIAPMNLPLERDYHIDLGFRINWE